MSKEIDHEYTDKCVCPYCGWEDEDYGDGPPSGEVQCGECKKFFHSEPSYSTSYTTSKLDCVNKIIPHDYREESYAKLPDGRVMWRCKICHKYEYRAKEVA